MNGKLQIQVNNGNRARIGNVNKVKMTKNVRKIKSQ